MRAPESAAVLPSWLEPRLARAEALAGGAPVGEIRGATFLGIDLGTSSVVTTAVDADGAPLGVRLAWADVVRDGVVLAFHEALRLVREQVASLEAELGCRFEAAATSFPPGTDARISANVIDAAGLRVSALLDEPTAVAALLGIEAGAVVDIGGGTTGVAVIEQGRVVYSGDEATGGHHVSLVLAGALNCPLEAAERYKREQGESAWAMVRPVFEKMTDIVQTHLDGRLPVRRIYLSGGSCSLPGVQALFADAFPAAQVILPQPCLFLTPLAIACSARSGA